MSQLWHVVHVKPRAEKKLRSYLDALHIWSYLPSRVRTRKVQRRTERIEEPIFPGYLLVRLKEGERAEVFRTNLVVSLIYLDRPRPVIHQLRDVMKAVKSEREMRIALPSEVSVGDTVRIAEGPLKGIVGHVVKNDKKSVLVIDVEVFGNAVAVELSPQDCVVENKL